MISFESVCIAYGKKNVVSDVNLEVERGEQHVILGESGAGKTSLLRALAGFVPLSSGRIVLDGVVVDDGRISRPPEKRGIGVVFQDYALFPHLDVSENIRFGAPTMNGREVSELLASVNLSGYEKRSVHELSGGEQQRVALARTLAQSPALVLLDEPFSNLNRALRRELRALTKARLKERGITSLYVSHDAEEALELADVISVMHQGGLLQSGAPQAMYRKPANYEVAASLGDVIVTPLWNDDKQRPMTEWGHVNPPMTHANGESLMLRPQDIEIEGEGEALVVGQLFLGASVEYELSKANQRIRIRCKATELHALGDAVATRIVNHLGSI